MNEKIIIVPDVHGRVFWKEIKKLPKEQKIIFLGDYLDPYLWEFDCNPELESEASDKTILLGCIENFKEIIEFKKSNPKNIILLLGNHCIKYFSLGYDTCRVDSRNYKEIFNLYNDNKKLFDIAYKWGNTLFTHAGVSKTWLKSNGLEDKITSENVEVYLNNMCQAAQWKEPIFGLGGIRNCNYTPLSDIGYSRGGDCPSGSCVWADIRDVLSDPAFPELKQVFGHTQLEETGNFIHQGNIWMCDSRCLFEYDGEKLKKYAQN